MWSELPKNLRTALALAILGAVGVAAAAFRLSFVALREVAEQPGLKFGRGNAWLLPIILDAALVVCEVILLAASMVRVRNKRGELETYDRTVPFLLVAIFGAATIYFNVTRVPAELRAVTVLPPAASILMTLALAYLMKMLARISGVDHIYEAPPALEPKRIVRKDDVLQGEILRPDASGQADALVQVPSSTTSVNPQTGQAGELSASDPAAKRALMRMYLAEMTPAESGRATGSSIVKAMKAIGVSVNDREARRVLDEWKAGQNGGKG
jgi:hypothetical protein